MVAAAAPVSPPPSPPQAPAEAAMEKQIYRTNTVSVHNLHPEVTELELYDVFSRFGDIESFGLCREQIPPYKSLCSGYINFLHMIDAARAADCLDKNVNLKGKSMRAYWRPKYYQRDPLTGEVTCLNYLIVENIDYSVTAAQLQNIFSKYGTILNCYMDEENGKSKGIGFVQFFSEESNLAAIAALHESTLDGRKIYVSKYVESEKKDVFEEFDWPVLHLKNIDKDVTKDLLRDKFSEYGKCDVVIMTDSEWKSIGLGMVFFKSYVDAKMAMDALNGSLLGSKRLSIGTTPKHYQDELGPIRWNKKNLNLCVRNIGGSMVDKELEEIFSPYGKVTSAKVMLHDNGLSRGYGFVSFSNAEEAKKAHESLNGKLFVGGKFIDVTVSNYKNKGMPNRKNKGMSNRKNEHMPNRKNECTRNIKNKCMPKPGRDLAPAIFPYINQRNYSTYSYETITTGDQYYKGLDVQASSWASYKGN